MPAVPGADHGPLGALDRLPDRLDARARALVDRAEGRVLVIGEPGADHGAGPAGAVVADPADLPAGGDGFDTVLSTFALCRVADLDATLAAVARLLAPGGRLLFLEHVPPPGWRRRARHAVAGAWAILAGGCRFDRDVPSAVRRAGLIVTDIERFTMPTAVWPLRSCAEGSARLSSRRAVGGAA